MTKRKSGLTEIQVILLTVLAAFVASQVGAFSPLLQDARRGAKLSTSISNMKQLALACLQYCQDWDESFPDSRASARTALPSEQQIIRFLTAKPEDPLPAGKNPGYGDILRDGYLKNSSILFSPFDTKHDTASYWWKCALDKAAVERGKISMNMIPSPAQVGIMYEKSPYYTGHMHGLINGARVLVAFADGHVKSNLTIKNGPASYPSREEFVGGGAAIRLGSPMFFNSPDPHNLSVADGYDVRSGTDTFGRF